MESIEQAGTTKPGNRQKIALIALAGAAIIAGGSIALQAMRSNGDAMKPQTAATDTPAADLPTMIRSQEERMRQNPGDTEGWRTLGWSYFQAKRFVDAAGAYAKLVRLAPKDATAWSALGEAQTLAVNAVDRTAHAAFAQAVALDPKDARARYFLAVEKDVGGDHKGAIDDWIALLKDGPADAPYAQSVHELVVQVAARDKIDIAGRLPDVAPPAAAGGEVASAGIPGPTPDQIAAAAQMTPSQQDAMAHGMVDTLAARLKQNPKDADGWIRLMRARSVLGDTAGARAALVDGKHAFAGDTATLTRLDDAARTLALPTG
jgi:cytochrome c-type biogenesis protein CcmH